MAELAAALEMSTDAGRTLIADGLELKYRLPQTLDPRHRRRRCATVAGPARSPKPRSGCPGRPAAFVDTHVAPFAHKVGVVASSTGSIAEATARFMPAQALADAAAAAERRHLSIHARAGLLRRHLRIDGELDLADALDLDAALTRGAETLEGRRVRGVARRTPLDGRRRHRPPPARPRPAASDQDPVVELSRRQPASRNQRPTQAAAGRPLRPPLRAAITGTTTPGGIDLARVENRRQGVTADQVRGLVRQPRHPRGRQTRHRPGRAHQRQRLRGPRPPRRTSPASATAPASSPGAPAPPRRCDCDHVIPHSRGGPTCSCNTAPLCRRHHRLKTHTAWTYTVLEPGTYLWTSPHGYQFCRDHTGTTDVTRLTPA